MANYTFHHLGNADTVNMLSLKAGNLELLTALLGTANLLAIGWAKLLFALLTVFSRDPAWFAPNQVAP